VTTAGQSGTSLRAEGSPRSAEAAGEMSRQEAARPAAPRRVKLSVSRVDPWSVMKLSFLLSVAFAIATVVAMSRSNSSRKNRPLPGARFNSGNAAGTTKSHA